MPYVKLDCAMIDSSIWPDKDGRDIFITALLMAAPREVREPLPQINVDNLELAGWDVPPGWYGFIEAAGTGIANRAGIDWPRASEALKRLGSPDQESRSPDFNGRRLVRVSGGYIVLNYIAYRDKDYGSAERMRRYRERKALRRNGDATLQDGATLPRNVTQAESREQRAESIGQLGATETAYAPSMDRGVQRGKDLGPTQPKNRAEEFGARAQEGIGGGDFELDPDAEPPAKRPDPGREIEAIPYGFANRVWEFWSVCQVSDRQDERGFFAKLAWADCCGFGTARPLMDILGRAKRARSPAAQVTHVLKTEFPREWEAFKASYPTHTHCLWALEEIEMGRRKEGRHE